MKNDNLEDKTDEGSSSEPKTSITTFQPNTSFNATIAAFEQLKEVANYISQSDIFTKGFEQRDAKGTILLDDNGKAKINTTDIVLCLMAGRELGIDITGSLLLGKKLDRGAYLAVLKGRELGIGVATSMEKIYAIEQKSTGKSIMYTGVDIISAKLNQGKVVFTPFVKDYAPLYEYNIPAGTSPINYTEVEDELGNIKDKFFVITGVTTANEVKTAQDSGKFLLTRKEIGKITTAKFVRTFPTGEVRVHIQSYTTIQAQIAGLLANKQAPNGDWVGGKDNWNSNPSGMLRNRTISIGGRIIGADLINGIYTEEEAKEIVDTTYQEVK